MGIAGGIKKVLCILAALKGRMIDILVTDLPVAEQLIKEAKQKGN